MKFVDPAKRRYNPEKEKNYDVQFSSLKKVFKKSNDANSNGDNQHTKPFSFLSMLKKQDEFEINSTESDNIPKSLSETIVKSQSSSVKLKTDSSKTELNGLDKKFNTEKKNIKKNLSNEDEQLDKSNFVNNSKSFFHISTTGSYLTEVATKFCNPNGSAFSTQSKQNLLDQCKLWHKKNNSKKSKRFVKQKNLR